MSKTSCKKQALSPVTTRNSSDKRLLERLIELEEKNKKLEEKVEVMGEEIYGLKQTVSELIPLKSKIEKLTDCNAVLSNVNDKLSHEVERLQQYSRRNCIVLEGIPTHRNESVESLQGKVQTAITSMGISQQEYASEFDKTHRIGPVRNQKEQRVIVRFKKHSLCEKIYSQRKKSRNIKVKPSLTKFRLNTLNSTKERFEQCELIDFIYADIQGNLKVRFKNAFDGYDFIFCETCAA